ncbi:hypothetical protein [Amphibacillus jilinensis]|uniref:hypothetical protein n=1 Tax=Amphibacillus jilinensis TaxID=1216008 RepID=UPI0002F2A69E|nr:hypothetical protein [Amphibacillus jilinensis]
MVGCLLINKLDWKKNGFDLQFFATFDQYIQVAQLADYPEWLCINVQADSKIPVWQMALDLEWANVTTGYGFGDNFDRAKADAIITLTKRTEVKISRSMP